MNHANKSLRVYGLGFLVATQFVVSCAGPVERSNSQASNSEAKPAEQDSVKETANGELSLVLPSIAALDASITKSAVIRISLCPDGASKDDPRCIVKFPELFAGGVFAFPKIAAGSYDLDFSLSMNGKPLFVGATDVSVVAGKATLANLELQRPKDKTGSLIINVKYPSPAPVDSKFTACDEVLKLEKVMHSNVCVSAQYVCSVPLHLVDGLVKTAQAGDFCNQDRAKLSVLNKVCQFQLAHSISNESIELVLKQLKCEKNL